MENNDKKIVNDTMNEVDLEDELEENSSIETNTTASNEAVYVPAAEEKQAYDVIPIPSKGQCYKSKTDRLTVSYLTAYDENIITSPNLYRDGIVIDILLKNKILDKNINTDELVSGDADAVTLWLRATSYGTDFPISVSDPETGKLIETSVDLSSIKMKDFKLKSDENGLFDYTLPHSKQKIKFKYLTRKEEKKLKLINDIEDKDTKSSLISDMNKELKQLINSDDVLSSEELNKVKVLSNELTGWSKKAKNNKKENFFHAVTNRMNMEIQSIDGETDRKKLNNMISSLPAGDSLALRKYILENEPGMDFRIEVERPKSMGGGSFKTFLEWGDSIFFYIA